MLPTIADDEMVCDGCGGHIYGDDYHNIDDEVYHPDCCPMCREPDKVICTGCGQDVDPIDALSDATGDYCPDCWPAGVKVEA